MNNDSYLTVATPGEGNFTEKRSRFLAFALHVENEEEAKRHLAELRKKYYDARHVCYAYALGPDGTLTRSSDDGEPSGSAGKPLLGQLRSFGVTFTLVAVVRYFGGVKLGTGGLAVAYKTAAADALTAATLEERLVMTAFRISVPYAAADAVLRHCREEEATVTNRQYSATDILLTVSVRQGACERLKEKINRIFSVKFCRGE